MFDLPTERFQALPALLGRITIGAVFIESGWGKLHNLPKVIEFFQSLNIPAASVQAPMVASIELVCGALILLGFLTRIAALLLIPVMTVAIITAKAGDISGWTDVFAFSEFLYIVILFWLLIEGAGRISLDHQLRRKGFNQ